ncbi:MAG: MerR family transcriptional regulator [Planctomycetota bacterium]
MISTKEIVERYGLPYSTVNHYTIIGLLTVEARRRNVRLYDEAAVEEKLTRIMKLKDKGYPLHLIQKELQKA